VIIMEWIMKTCRRVGEIVRITLAISLPLPAFVFVLYLVMISLGLSIAEVRQLLGGLLK
jgi:hypothetical protein